MSGKDYIIPSLGGRLGNQMFMIAHAYAQSLKQNRELKISRHDLRYEGNEYDTNIFRKFQFIPNFESKDKSAIVYGGYFQSEKHFEEYSDEIIEKYSPSPSFISTVEEVFPMITNRDKIITVVNVRRGDYLMFPDYHPTVSEEYIHSAIKLIPDTDQYLVASDDLDWCKAKLKFDKPVTYLQGWKSHEQLWIMSMCHHFIISNSSFSWWAAYLSTYKDKMVVAPKTWFGPKFSGGWEDMYCKDWIIHPTYFDNGKIYPGKRKRV
tara:strand:+ start:373 stop:1164 length:792 start_codon:yes stop_codon:yes gene_type:complete